MNCPHCKTKNIVKNGNSQHGRQRFLCRDCQRTFGVADRRRVCAATQAQARRLYLEGVGFRGIERLLGVSHVSVMNWVKAQARSLPPLPGVDPAEVEWVECDELCTFIGKKKPFAGSGGLLIVLPNASADGRWAIAAPKRPKVFLRSYLAALT